jgi:hypothetical protein
MGMVSTYSLYAERKASDGRSRRDRGDVDRWSVNDNALAVAEGSTTRVTTVLLGEGETREGHGEDNEGVLLEEHCCGGV